MMQQTGHFKGESLATRGRCLPVGAPTRPAVPCRINLARSDRAVPPNSPGSRRVRRSRCMCAWNSCGASSGLRPTLQARPSAHHWGRGRDLLAPGSAHGPRRHAALLPGTGHRTRGAARGHRGLHIQSWCWAAADINAAAAGQPAGLAGSGEGASALGVRRRQGAARPRLTSRGGSRLAASQCLNQKALDCAWLHRQTAHVHLIHINERAQTKGTWAGSTQLLHLIRFRLGTPDRTGSCPVQKSR